MIEFTTTYEVMCESIAGFTVTDEDFQEYLDWRTAQGMYDFDGDKKYDVVNAYEYFMNFKYYQEEEFDFQTLDSIIMDVEMREPLTIEGE